MPEIVFHLNQLRFTPGEIHFVTFPYTKVVESPFSKSCTHQFIILWLLVKISALKCYKAGWYELVMFEIGEYETPAHKSMELGMMEREKKVVCCIFIKWILLQRMIHCFCVLYWYFEKLNISYCIFPFLEYRRGVEFYFSRWVQNKWIFLSPHHHKNRKNLRALSLQIFCQIKA